MKLCDASATIYIGIIVKIDYHIEVRLIRIVNSQERMVSHLFCNYIPVLRACDERIIGGKWMPLRVIPVTCSSS